MEIPKVIMGQKQLLLSLMNIRMPGPARWKFFEVQDIYLQEETAEKGIVDLNSLEPAKETCADHQCGSLFSKSRI